MEFEDIITKINMIADELDARELANNCLHMTLSGLSWTELCDAGIQLFEQLKHWNENEEV